MELYSKNNLTETKKRKIPNNFPISFLFTLWTVFAPTLAINVVMGTNIKKAGILTKPKLKAPFIAT